MTEELNSNLNPNNDQINSETPENTADININQAPIEETESPLVVEIPSSNPEEKIELQVNEEALKEQNLLFDSLKNDVNNLNENANTLDEIKVERKNMVELKEKLLSLFLVSKTERDEYIDVIQSKFEKLKETSEALKNEINAKLDENLKLIEPKVQTVLKEAENPENFGEIRKKLIELQAELKEYELHRDRKDDFFSLVQQAFESLDEKQDLEREKYEMEISENYLNVKPKVLDSIKFAVQTDNFNQAREKLIEAQNDLKGLKLKKTHLDELFGLIRLAFENVNTKQDGERDKLKADSEENYKEVKPFVEDAVKFADETEDFEAARKRLIETQKEIKLKSLTRGQRDELYGLVREVFNRLNEKQDSNRGEFLDECNANYAKLEISVNEAAAYIDFTNNLNDIREGLIAVQDEVKIVKLTRAQRNELFKRIRLGFSRFDEKRNEFIKSRKDYKKANKTEVTEPNPVKDRIESDLNSDVEKENTEE